MGRFFNHPPVLHSQRPLEHRYRYNTGFTDIAPPHRSRLLAGHSFVLADAVNVTRVTVYKHLRLAQPKSTERRLDSIDYARGSLLCVGFVANGTLTITPKGYV